MGSDMASRSIIGVQFPFAVAGRRLQCWRSNHSHELVWDRSRAGPRPYRLLEFAMSEGLPPQPPQGPTPAPQPQGQPTPPPESFQAKVNRLISQIMPPADPAN